MTYITKETEIEIDIYDVLEFIDNCNSNEQDQIRESLLPIKEDATPISSLKISADNLYDEMKCKEIERIWNKYSLDDLKKL